MVVWCACTGCLRTRAAAEFRPAAIERFARKGAAFDEILRQLENDETSEELGQRLDTLRTKKCFDCRKRMQSYQANPNTTTGQCRALWYSLRCAPCADCHRADGFSEYDHVEGEKIHNLGDYMWWVWNGGVEAMQAEAKKCVPRCRNCHSMQHSGNKYKRKYATIEEMPTNTPQERIAKLTRTYLDEKIAFVDSHKLRLGACADCRMGVTESSCHVFVFAHRDATSKTKSVAQLCNNHATLPTTRPALEAEMAKCRLLCAVCHSKETRERNTTSEALRWAVRETGRPACRLSQGPFSPGKGLRVFSNRSEFKLCSSRTRIDASL